jgi:hypothetical protein
MAVNWLRGLDLNQRPSGYEPDELPGCSTPRSRTVELARRFIHAQAVSSIKTARRHSKSNNPAALEIPDKYACSSPCLPAWPV